MIKPNQRFLLLNHPREYRALIDPLPERVTLNTEPRGVYDVIQVFIASRKELEQRLPRVRSSMSTNGIVWVTYPKGTSKIMKSNVNRDSIRKYGQTIGLEADAIFSVDEDWSALRMKRI